ncbi:MAG: GNAT family N-acetyltransferase [Roseburia sp.]
MNISYKTTKENVNWQEVAEVLDRSGLSHHTAEEQEIMFTNSYSVVFVYDDDRIVGVARALSDGISQASVYNIALDKEYQGNGIGREMIERLLAPLAGQTIILYTHPKNLGLYEKLGFRRNKTAMCIMAQTPEHMEWMEKTGFLLPENYRFEGEEKWEFHK